MKTETLRVLKMSKAVVLAWLLMAGSLTTRAAAQLSSSVGGATSSAVPRLVKFSGVVKDEQGRPQSGVAGITFALYKDQSGGAPLWLETQNVQADSTGRYTAFLGAGKPDGLPVDLFMSGDARWLSVQVVGQAEQPRVLLVSTPYALKAADAETLGGLPASAFALAAPTNSNAATTPAGPDASASAPPPASNVTGAGSASFVPLWTSTSNIGNSVVFQSGSGSTAKVGIGTTTPGATLDVKGGATIEGPLSLPPISAATATKGESSQAVGFVASSYDSSTRAPLSQTFVLKAEPANNNTSTTSGTLNLLFGAGTTTPTETGLKLTSTGIFTFASGQTFPGTGTITGVTTGSHSGLTGGGTTGNLSLSLTNTCADGQVLQWNGSAWVCVSVGSGTITGVTAGTDLTGGGASNNVTLNLDVAKTDARYPQLAAASNTFTGSQSVGGSITAAGIVSGQQLISTIPTAPPLVVSSTIQVPNLNASLLGGQSASHFGTITAVSPGTDLTGGGTTGSITLNLDTAKVPQLAAANVFTNSQAVMNGGRMGIGTMSPMVPLQIEGTDNTGTGVQARVGNLSTSVNSFAVLAADSNIGVNSVTTQMVTDGVGTGPLNQAGGYLGTFTNHPLGFTTNNTVRMLIDTQGNVNINNNLAVGGGVKNDGGGLKHQRFGVTCFSSEQCGSLVSWNTPFADANYTVSAVVVDDCLNGSCNSGAGVGMTFFRVTNRQAGSVFVEVFNNDSVTHTGTVDLIAVHD